MSLKDLLQLSSNRQYQKQGLSQERLLENIDGLRKLISFFRQYPDIFVDFIKGEESNFEFLFYQRIFLRIVMRHRYVYATFPRECVRGSNCKITKGNLFNCGDTC